MATGLNHVVTQPLQRLTSMGGGGLSGRLCRCAPEAVGNFERAAGVAAEESYSCLSGFPCNLTSSSAVLSVLTAPSAFG